MGRDDRWAGGRDTRMRETSNVAIAPFMGKVSIPPESMYVCSTMYVTWFFCFTLHKYLARLPGVWSCLESPSLVGSFLIPPSPQPRVSSLTCLADAHSLWTYIHIYAPIYIYIYIDTSTYIYICVCVCHCYFHTLSLRTTQGLHNTNPPSH